jgi:hypothetical protein
MMYAESVNEVFTSVEGRTGSLTKWWYVEAATPSVMVIKLKQSFTKIQCNTKPKPITYMAIRRLPVYKTLLPEVTLAKRLLYPQLYTDEKGQILIDFTMPEALTKWRFKALP